MLCIIYLVICLIFLVCFISRLPSPKNSPDFMYGLMLECWEDEPKDRPSFCKSLTYNCRLNGMCVHLLMMIAAGIFQRLLAAYNLVKPLSAGNERPKQEMDADGNVVDKKQDVRSRDCPIELGQRVPGLQFLMMTFSKIVIVGDCRRRRGRYVRHGRRRRQRAGQEASCMIIVDWLTACFLMAWQVRVSGQFGADSSDDNPQPVLAVCWA